MIPHRTALKNAFTGKKGSLRRRCIAHTLRPQRPTAFLSFLSLSLTRRGADHLVDEEKSTLARAPTMGLYFFVSHSRASERLYHCVSRECALKSYRKKRPEEEVQCTEREVIRTRRCTVRAMLPIGHAPKGYAVRQANCCMGW